MDSKKWRKNSGTECNKSQTNEAACKQGEDEPAKTREHAEGHNEATAAADKGRNEATAATAKKKLDRDLRSQNNINCTSEEEDEEIMAVIDERRKVKKEDKE